MKGKPGHSTSPSQGARGPRAALTTGTCQFAINDVLRREMLGYVVKAEVKPASGHESIAGNVHEHQTTIVIPTA